MSLNISSMILIHISYLILELECYLIDFVWWSLKGPIVLIKLGRNLLGAGVLGDSLGTLRDSVLGKLSREEEPDSSLDFTRGDGGPLVVVGQTGSLSSNSLKEIIDKAVHDAHGLG